MNIIELLLSRGLDTSSRIKLVRHKDHRPGLDVHDLYRRGLLEYYQSYQAKKIFKCKYVVSFLGEENYRARFVGVYTVHGCEPAIENPPHLGIEIYDRLGEYDVYYNLQPLAGFDDLVERLVIDWGPVTRAWHQWLVPKEIVEM